MTIWHAKASGSPLSGDSWFPITFSRSTLAFLHYDIIFLPPTSFWLMWPLSPIPRLTIGKITFHISYSWKSLGISIVEPNNHFSFSCLSNVACARQIFGTQLKLCVFGNSRGMKTAYKVSANTTAWMFVFIMAALVPADATEFQRTVILL